MNDKLIHLFLFVALIQFVVNASPEYNLDSLEPYQISRAIMQTQTLEPRSRCIKFGITLLHDLGYYNLDVTSPSVDSIVFDLIVNLKSYSAKLRLSGAMTKRLNDFVEICENCLKNGATSELEKSASNINQIEEKNLVSQIEDVVKNEEAKSADTTLPGPELMKDSPIEHNIREKFPASDESEIYNAEQDLFNPIEDVVKNEEPKTADTVSPGPELMSDSPVEQYILKKFPVSDKSREYNSEKDLLTQFTDDIYKSEESSAQDNDNERENTDGLDENDDQDEEVDEEVDDEIDDFAIDDTDNSRIDDHVNEGTSSSGTNNPLPPTGKTPNHNQHENANHGHIHTFSSLVKPEHISTTSTTIPSPSTETRSTFSSPEIQNRNDEAVFDSSIESPSTSTTNSLDIQDSKDENDQTEFSSSTEPTIPTPSFPSITRTGSNNSRKKSKKNSHKITSESRSTSTYQAGSKEMNSPRYDATGGRSPGIHEYVKRVQSKYSSNEQYQYSSGYQVA